MIDKKKYYLIYDESGRIPWEIIHCKSKDGEGSNFPEDIAKSIVSYKYIGPFKLSEYICTNNKDVKNDYDLFILENMYGDRFIWQIGNLVHDMEGNIIPNTYHVRQIGMIVNYRYKIITE